MENKVSEQELRTKFPIFFEKIERVIFESRKYNLIDRFFHFYIEKNEILKYVISLKLDINTGLDLVNYIGLLDLEIGLLIEKIKKSYGIISVEFYKKTEKKLFIENPDLLGISPFLFEQEEWAEIIIDDIRKSSYEVDDINHLYNRIENCLNETLERLDKKDFNSVTFSYKWNKEVSTPSGISSLVVDDIYDLDKNPKSTKSIIKNLIKKNSETQLSKIVLYGNFTTGKLIETMIEKFGKKSIKLSNDNIEDIKSFVGQNFKNSKGKNLGFKEIKSKSFFSEHIKLIKIILIDNVKKEHIKCTEKDIARIINKTLPELGELKTIENY
jgi:hypothetical protein